MRLLLALAFLVGCAPDPVDSGDTEDTDVVDWSQATDLDLATALADGSGPDTRSALLQLAWAGGLPVPTEDGWLIFAEGTGPYSVIGDHNGWSPEPMAQTDTGLWWVEVTASTPAGSRYQLVEGDDAHGDRWSRSYDWQERGMVSYLAAPPEAHLERWPDLVGQDLLPRDLLVHVPAGSGPWPVLYVQDGQNLYDPGAPWGGWRLQDTLRAKDSAVLVVGIASTAARFGDYTHVPDVIDGVTLGGNADAYSRLLHDQVRPFVEGHYGSTGKDGLLGSSLGGLVSLYVALKHPGAYDFAASMSGTLGWGRFGADNTPMEALYLDAAVQPTAVFLDSGGSDGGDGCDDPDLDGLPEDDPNDADNYCVNRHMADHLADHGYTWQTNLYHWHEPGDPHNELAWAARVHRPLDLFEAL